MSWGGSNLPWDRICAMFRDQTRIAEDSGFATVWCTEHHFAHNGYLNAPPNPTLMCAHLGAPFERIRLVQAPVVVPDWHRLRVDEDIAPLDNMTGGRVDFGGGRGNNELTRVPYNIHADKRNTEERSMALYLEALTVVDQ